MAAAMTAPSSALATPAAIACTSACKVRLTAVHAGNKGLRRSMEDEHVILDDAGCRALVPDLPAAVRFYFYAVIDGHGGRDVAAFVRDQLPPAVLGQVKVVPSPMKAAAVKVAIKKAYDDTAEAVVAACAANGWKDGACCVALLVLNDMAYVINLGDSKAVVCRRTGALAPALPAGAGGLTKCRVGFHAFACTCPALPPADGKQLTQDHKPVLLSERERIEKAGGTVEDGRVNGQLEVARSFGDVSLRRFGVTSDPDLRVNFKLTPADEFVVLACDGLWTRHTPATAVQLLRQRLAVAATHRAAGCARVDCMAPEHGWDLDAVVKGFIDHSVEEMGVKDNVTALLIQVAQ